MPMQTCTFKVVVEPDEKRWHAYGPALRNYGAATRAEAYKIHLRPTTTQRSHDPRRSERPPQPERLSHAGPSRHSRVAK